MMDFARLLLPDAGWAHLMIGSESDADNFVLAKVHSGEIKLGTIVRFIRATHDRCSTPDRLFQEWAAALQFPWYFGHNWDAWDECIRDLEWLGGNAFVLFITRAEQVLPNRERDFRIFTGGLELAAREWATPVPADSGWCRPAIPFRVVFQCEPEYRGDVRKRLEDASVTLADW